MAFSKYIYNSLSFQAKDNLLTPDIVGENLSLLCKTGNGLAHAFVRLDVKNK